LRNLNFIDIQYVAPNSGTATCNAEQITETEVGSCILSAMRLWMFSNENTEQIADSQTPIQWIFICYNN
jgi:hypothetical protein